MSFCNTSMAMYLDCSQYGRNHNLDTVVYFGGVCSNRFGVYLTDIRIADSPKRDISFLSIPGRNGDLIIDNNRWNNVDITYSFAITKGFSGGFDAFKAALLSQNGYQELSDSIYPEVFRLAIVKAAINPKPLSRNRAGTFDVTFHCKPQRYLKSGRTTIHITKPTTLYGGGFAAKPLVTVYGSGPGTLTIGKTTVEIKDMDDRLTLDCDLQTAYRYLGDSAPENMNGNIYAPSFPELGKGENPISWTGGISNIDIIPRWWTI